MTEITSNNLKRRSGMPRGNEVINAFVLGVSVSARMPEKEESVVPAQVVLGLIIFFVSYIGTALLMIELLMWVMSRLDDPAASSRSRVSAIGCELASSISVQANLALAYVPERDSSGNIEADQFDCPRTPTPQFQLSEEFDELPFHRFNIHSAGEATSMPVK